MKTSISFILSIAAIVTAAIIILDRRKENALKMAAHASEEGYETAHDILYPGKSSRFSNLRYGPVIPANQR